MHKVVLDSTVLVSAFLAKMGVSLKARTDYIVTRDNDLLSLENYEA